MEFSGGSSLVAHISFTANGQPRRIEMFGDYVLRQLGLRRDHNPMAARLGDVAMAYLASGGDGSSLGDILMFFSKLHAGGEDAGGGDPAAKAAAAAAEEDDMKALQAALVEELEACLLSYFAFHWQHSAALMDQVGFIHNGQRKLLRSIVAAATREGRVQRVMQTLKTKRAFSTLLEEMKSLSAGASGSDDVVVAAEASARSPVLLLIGGGMGAGKSTAVAEILRSTFWAAAASGAVVVEADAFKEADVVYQAMAAMGDSSIASQVVHQSSTDAAASLLVAALNSGRDVIFDGTMSWAPFVRQTIAMARDVHRQRYRMGAGYQRSADGEVIEEYWTPEEEHEQQQQQQQQSRPYRIELVGVTCHPLLAVVRGIRRGIVTKRSVPIEGQLRSHKLFGQAIDEYCALVDQARIYSSNSTGAAPELIGCKDGLKGKLLIDPDAFSLVRRVAALKPDAGSFVELFEDSARSCGPWKQVVLSSERPARQELLRKLLSGNADFRSFSMSKPSVAHPQPDPHHPHMQHSTSAPLFHKP